MKKETKKEKQVVKQPKILPKNAKQRQRPKYKSFRLHKRIKHHAPKLPSWWNIVKRSFVLLIANRRAIAIFFIIFAVLNLLFIRGFERIIDTEAIQETLTTVVDEDTVGIASGFTAFGLLINADSAVQGGVTQLYQTILLLVGSLAIVWLYRQQQAGNKVTMKQAFYRGMYPLIPFLLVLVVLALQLLPAIIGNFLFQTVLQSNLIVGGLELSLWVLLLLFTMLLSLYMLSSSIIGLYIVTLPEMTPMSALREARELVRHRRIGVMIRLFALIVVMVAILFVVVLPIIFFAPLVAEWLFFALTILAIPFAHAYLFILYRELL